MNEAQFIKELEEFHGKHFPTDQVLAKYLKEDIYAWDTRDDSCFLLDHEHDVKCLIESGNFYFFEE